MAAEITGLRAQILANAKILVKSTPSNRPTPSSSSQATLTSVTLSNYYGDLDVVVFGSSNEYIAALMSGLTPAIEGDKATSPEGAMRKLFLATSELLKAYIPKVGSHQRNIHGGGVFDEDMISGEIVEAQRRVR